MKELLFVLFVTILPFAAQAEGPLFQHKDTVTQQEFENAYQSIRASSVFSSSGTSRCIDSPTLCVDTLNDRVGVGTNTPANPLDVFVSGSRAFSIDTSGQFAFTGRVNSVTNNNDGNTVISVINANATSNALSTVFANNNTSNTYLRHFGTNYTGTLFGITQANYGIIENSSGGAGLMFNTLAATPLIFGTNSVEALRIGSTQRVGIGTPTPVSKLHLSSGVLTIDGTTSGISVSTITGISGNTVRISTFGATSPSISVVVSGAVALVGSKTNDSAAAGEYGETVSSVISTPTNFPATTVWGDLTSVSLTAGNWIVTAQIDLILNGATQTQTNLGVSTTAGNDATGLVVGDSRLLGLPPNVNTDTAITIAGYSMKVAATTTVYLKYMSLHSAGTPQARGRLSAIRCR